MQYDWSGSVEPVDMNQSHHHRSTIVHESHRGIECAILANQSCSEIHLVATPEDGESVAELCRRVVVLCGQRGVGIVSMTTFIPPGEAEFMGEEPKWPITRLRAVSGAGGVVAYALSDHPLQTLRHEGQVVGNVYEIDGARYCRLAGVLPARESVDAAEEAGAVFEQMEGVLRTADFRFRDVIRTWFFNGDIIAWYDTFNRTRDAFFAEREIRGAAAPASTGIGIVNQAGRALTAELLAVTGGGVKRTVVPSPLQCSAVDYGSSFSRALELETVSRRTLYISGTASIAPDGRTEFVGDAEKQIALTMRVVEALLGSRGMTWSDTVRAIAFFKHISDLHHFRSYCESHGLGTLPVLSVRADVCRPELLFEVELEAAVCK